ncbi:tRNA epoxyqueuosine(34) reductase QueG [Psychromonas ossibalaenae]|uniref:tRNA epoxyqueuosine(34) reductase QueG n=1 Tax=Psychromonas ossibalaenae TaxID=444922 RepID=UPI000360F56F|nr:tRNA epoxyqueuosine(34) reductase QueG [Psychromonas ossibalaenae]
MTSPVNSSKSPAVTTNTKIELLDLSALSENIKLWGKELGFQEVGITDIDLKQHESKLQQWLDNSYHGEMDYMEKHGMKRARPDELHPGTLRVISVRMDYLPDNAQFARTLKDKNNAYISRYALGRDYHKVLRKRLKQLGQKIEQQVGSLGYRPFVDSAPVLERPLAEKAGLGWVGKHSLLIDAKAGSWFFIGELMVDLPLPVDKPVENRCGQCVACLKICPTDAIVAPYIVDGRRCISYLTIELQGPIPAEFRKAIGNRIYGCDDCQLICPWNRFADTTQEADYQVRQQLHKQPLLDLFNWTEAQFLTNTEGSPIRRIGYQRWLRNIAVALGNAPTSEALVTALNAKLINSESELLNEHIEWALTQHKEQIPLVNERLKQRLIKAVEKGLPRDA